MTGKWYAERSGRMAERLEMLKLRLTGWHILGRRVKTWRGEIDLVARRGRTVVFFEVKWRSRPEDLDRAIDHHRLKRVAAAVQAIAHRYVEDGDEMRIDVLLAAPGARTRRIENAWMP
jgi:putative endonuclease